MVLLASIVPCDTQFLKPRMRHFDRENGPYRVLWVPQVQVVTFIWCGRQTDFIIQKSGGSQPSKKCMQRQTGIRMATIGNVWGMRRWGGKEPCTIEAAQIMFLLSLSGKCRASAAEAWGCSDVAIQPANRIGGVAKVSLPQLNFCVTFFSTFTSVLKSLKPDFTSLAAYLPRLLFITILTC